MASLFGMKKPKPDAAVQEAQRRQARDLTMQEQEANQEMGARNRLLAARQKGRGPVTMFANTGASGVLGGS